MMNRFYASLICFVIVSGFMPTLYAAAPVVDAQLSSASFDGKTYKMALQIPLPAGAKTYWRQAGGAGLAPEFNIDGSDNLKFFDVAFPPPKKMLEGDVVVLGYDTPVAFLLTLAPQQKERPIQFKLKFTFGICERVCIPVEKTFETKLLPVSSIPHPALEIIQKQLPLHASARVSIESWQPLQLELLGQGRLEAQDVILEVQGEQVLTLISSSVERLSTKQMLVNFSEPLPSSWKPRMARLTLLGAKKNYEVDFQVGATEEPPKIALVVPQAATKEPLAKKVAASTPKTKAQSQKIVTRKTAKPARKFAQRRVVQRQRQVIRYIYQQRKSSWPSKPETYYQLWTYD